MGVIIKDKTQSLPSGVIHGPNIKAGRIKWLWQNRLIYARINELQGAKTAGKSSVATNLAVRITHGIKMPGSKGNLPDVKNNTSCIWVSREEDGPTEILPRWVANGGGVEKLFVFRPKARREAGILLPSGVDAMIDFVRDVNASVLVVDPFSALVDHTVSMKDEPSVREYMEAFTELTEKTKVTVILLRHLKKGKSSNMLEQGLGSVAISNVARVVLRCMPHPVESDKRLFHVVAANGGRPVSPYTFCIGGEENGPPVVNWMNEESYNLEELEQQADSVGQVDEERDAVSILREILSPGDRPCVEILKEARNAGISERTMRTAKAKLKVTHRRVRKEGTDTYWSVWRLPKEPNG